MSDHQPPRRRPPRDDSGHDDVLFLDPDEREEPQAIVGTDPFVEEYLRSPYDPINAARMEGRLLGEVIRRPRRSRWMRAFAALLGLALVAAGALGIGVALAGGPFDPTSMVVAVVFAVAGLGILWRLVDRPGAR